MRHTNPFSTPPPPSCARARRRRCFTGFQRRSCPPPPPSQAKASRRRCFTSLQPHSRPYLFLCMQKRAERGVLLHFDPDRAPASSLACKSELEEVFCGASTPLTPSPPPSYAKASRRRCFMALRPRSRPRLLPRMQKRAGGGVLWRFYPVHAPASSLARKSEPEEGFHEVSTPFEPPNSLVLFRPRSDAHHLPRMQKRDGGGTLCPSKAPPPPFCGFGPVRTPTTSPACKSETQVVLYGPISLCASKSKIGSIFGFSSPFSALPPPSHAKLSLVFSSFQFLVCGICAANFLSFCFMYLHKLKERLPLLQDNIFISYTTYSTPAMK